MNMDERIARINALYHKSQNEGLTEEDIERPDGTMENLGEKFGGKPRRES